MTARACATRRRAALAARAARDVPCLMPQRACGVCACSAAQALAQSASCVGRDADDMASRACALSHCSHAHIIRRGTAALEHTSHVYAPETHSAASIPSHRVANSSAHAWKMDPQRCRRLAASRAGGLRRRARQRVRARRTCISVESALNRGACQRAPRRRAALSRAASVQRRNACVSGRAPLSRGHESMRIVLHRSARHARRARRRASARAHSAAARAVMRRAACLS
jgi:hypothetical protein